MGGEVFFICLFTKCKVLGVPQKSCDNSLDQLRVLRASAVSPEDPADAEAVVCRGLRGVQVRSPEDLRDVGAPAPTLILFQAFRHHLGSTTWDTSAQVRSGVL